ncbi:hypothetical protein BDM02DRAFT_3133348, partial [Thelephora ganbajun]
MPSYLLNSLSWYFRSYVPFLHSDTLWAVAIASFRSNVAHHAELCILWDPIVDILEVGLTNWEGADCLADSSIDTMQMAAVVGEHLLSLHEHHEARLRQVKNQLHLLAGSVDVLVHCHHGDVMALQCWVSELEASDIKVTGGKEKYVMTRAMNDNESVLFQLIQWGVVNMSSFDKNLKGTGVCYSAVIGNCLWSLFKQEHTRNNHLERDLFKCLANNCILAGKVTSLRIKLGKFINN